MKITLSDLKQSLLSKTGSRSLSNIANFYSMVQETCFAMMENVDLPSAIRKVPFLAPLAESPNLYILPNDFSFNGLIDVYDRAYTLDRPRVRTATNSSEFMRRIQSSSLVNMDTIDSVQFLNIRDTQYKKSFVIDPCDDQTIATWTAIGTANNVRFDAAHKITGTGSIAFGTPDTGSEVGISQASFFSPASTTNMAYITANVYFPEYTASVTVKYGDNASNYKAITVTTDWQGNRLNKGWNTLVFPIANATTVGTIAGTTILYFAITIPSSTLQTDYRIDGMSISADYNYDLRYYSNSIITNQYGERKDNCLPTSDTDIILLNHREHALFLKQFAVISSVDTMTDGGARQFNAYNAPLQKSYENFSAEFPSERILVATPY